MARNPIAQPAGERGPLTRHLVSRRRRYALAAVVLIAGAVVPQLAGAEDGGGSAAPPGPAPASTDTGSGTDASSTPSRETATVQRRDLTETEEFDGELGYGEPRELRSGGAGTLTALPAVAAVIHRGESLWEVDGAAGPILLHGARPMWRSLRNGVDDGADVRQLEENLVALGFPSELTVDGQLTVDDEFDARTTAAVKAWQKARGVEVTGVVDQRDVIFAAGDVRIAELLANVGDPAEGAIVSVTGPTQIVMLDIDADKVDLLPAGSEVQVELPDGSLVDAVVYAISQVATSTDDGMGGRTDPTLEAVVALTGAVDALDSAPVTVVVTRTEASGVLTVPVRALLALAEGGYAIERVLPAGTELVPIELGVFGDGVVEALGDIAEGDEVVVAP